MWHLGKIIPSLNVKKHHVKLYRHCDYNYKKTKTEAHDKDISDDKHE